MVLFVPTFSSYVLDSRRIYNFCNILASCVNLLLSDLEILQLSFVVGAQSANGCRSRVLAPFLLIDLLSCLEDLLFVALVTALAPLVSHRIGLDLFLSHRANTFVL